MIHIRSAEDQGLKQAARLLQTSAKAVALTGAGISVGSGIPDFRSPGGLWSIYEPDEYATLAVFRSQPAKAWQLYRALGEVLLGKMANAAHRALAEMERRGLLAGVVTQNVDNLHQQAGSRVVLEIHGDHQHLQCLDCEHLEPVAEKHYRMQDIPLCPVCSSALKPNVVLFGEPVRMYEEIENLVADCDLLLVVGTSAQVYPAAGLPLTVKLGGGRVFEFNQEPALGRDQFSGLNLMPDFFFEGDVVETLPLLLAALDARS
jgi:NAD-dependent deacetylase